MDFDGTNLDIKTQEFEVIDGNAKFSGDLDVNEGTISTSNLILASQDSTTFNLSGNDLVIDTNQFTIDEEGNATFSGNITSEGTIDYSNLNVAFASLNNARVGGDWVDDDDLDPASNQDDYNYFIARNIDWRTGSGTVNDYYATVILYHQTLNVLTGGSILDWCSDGETWQSNDASMSVYNHISIKDPSRLTGTGGEPPTTVLVNYVRPNRVSFELHIGSSDPPSTYHFRFKRHSIN